MPLFTAEDLAEWNARYDEAKTPRDTDEFPYPNRQYNASLQARVSAHHQAFKMERLRRIAARPEDVANLLLVAFHEKGTTPLSWDEAFGGLGERLTAADTPETRKHVHAVLTALKTVPRSWAKSAATRFFRGTGAQGKPPWSNKPGAGVLSKDYDWKQYQAEWFMEFFYTGHFCDLFFPDDSPDCYGAEAYEIDEAGGNRFAATRKERDDEFFDALIGVLEARGLAQVIDKPDIPQPKPHKAKVFQPGDKVTTKNVRDLPSGSHIRFTLHLSGRAGPRGAEGHDVTRHYVLEGVYVERKKPGLYEIRPLVAPGVVVSPVLVNKWAFADAEYIGPWGGQTLDGVEVKRYEVEGWYSWDVRWAWKPVSRTTTQGKDDSVPLVR